MYVIGVGDGDFDDQTAAASLFNPFLHSAENDSISNCHDCDGTTVGGGLFRGWENRTGWAIIVNFCTLYCRVHVVYVM